MLGSLSFGQVVQTKHSQSFPVFSMGVHGFQVRKQRDDLLDFMSDVRPADLQGKQSLTMVNTAQGTQVCGLV